MYKDERYLTVKSMLRSGEILEFEQIFIHVPKTVLRDDLRTSSNRLDKLIENPHKFKLYELWVISRLIEVHIDVIVNLAFKKYFREQNVNVTVSVSVNIPENYFR